ncbi:MAG TPA: acyltransferase [Anaerolineales bacterium]|nr:acyltransferase [Anaerolineales bacterium]
MLDTFVKLYFNAPDMIPGLDGLRALAFLLVFAFHTDYLQVGWVGVSLFFVLSGFLITGILLDMKKSLSTRDYFFKFYGRRFLRIFPLYYFYLILMTIVTTWLIGIVYRPLYMQIFLDQVRFAFFYVYDFFFGTANFQYSFFLDHFWSLSVEEQFYIFWPLSVLLVPEKSLKKLFLGFIVLGPILRLAVYFIHQSGVFRFLADTAPLAIFPLPFSYIDAFAFGAYISRFTIPKAKTQFFLLLGIMPIIGYGAQYLATGKIGTVSALGYPLLLPESYQFIWGYTLLNYFFAVTIYSVVNDRIFIRFLESPPLQYLGKISYGLYVYHFPIIWFSMRLRDFGIVDPFAKPVIAVVSFVATLLVASISYKLLEQPLLNLKDRFFNRRETSVPEGVRLPLKSDLS